MCRNELVLKTRSGVQRIELTLDPNMHENPDSVICNKNVQVNDILSITVDKYIQLGTRAKNCAETCTKNVQK